MQPETIPQTTKPRKPWIAAVLSLVTTGLGHVYCGEPGRGIAAYLAFSVCSILAIFAFGTFSGLIILLAVLACLYLGIAVDAALRARKIREIRLRWYNRPSVYLLVVVLSVLGSQLFRQIIPFLPYRAYKIPAGSMEPTLQIGDRLIVDTRAYRKQPPRRGDLVVFLFPMNPTRDFVKRCVAVAGDRVEIRDKRLSVNGKPVAEPYVIHVDPETVQAGEMGMGAVRDQFGPSVVPPEAFFALGDNRDNSNDSRFWGPVPNNLAKGKAAYVYWAKDWSRIGTTFR